MKHGINRLIKHHITMVVGILIMTGCTQRDSSAEWAGIIDTYYEVWSTGNVDLLDGILDGQFVGMFGTTIYSEDLASIKAFITRFREAYPDKQVTIDELVPMGDRAAARWSWTATHSGVRNPALKGRQINMTGISIYRMKRGKLVEERSESDGATMIKQLGYTITPPSVAGE